MIGFGIDITEKMEQEIRLQQSLEEKQSLLGEIHHRVKNNLALVTGLVTNQALRTAEILDLETIIFVRGKKPSQSVIELADEIGITLIATELTMYRTSGLLFMNGVKSYESVLEEN